MNNNHGSSGFAKLREKTGLSLQAISGRFGCGLRTVYRWESGETKPRRYIFDFLQQYADTTNTPTDGRNLLFTFIDLFAGIGGIRKGFESVGGSCIFTSELDAACRRTYQTNFSCNHPVEGDITLIKEQDIPHHDVLVAGFPCQPFSIAGVSKMKSLGRKHGFENETQGALFFEVERIIAYHHPAAIFFENVKNLVSHDGGDTFKVILRTLEELGYNVYWRVIDSKGFVPQHRERLYIVGFRKETPFKFDALAIPDPGSKTLRMILHPEDGSEPEEPPYTTGEQALVSEKYRLSPQLWEYLQQYAKKHRAKGNGFGFGLVSPDDISRTLSARYYKDGSEILLSRDGYVRPRRLTPRECARLMGFDAPGKPFDIPVSDTQAYKQFGNAVAVPVVEAIARHMLLHIIRDTRNASGQLELALQQ